MSLYAAPQDLLDRFSATEMAQVANRSETARVDGLLLSLTVAGGDRSAYSPEEVAAADAAAAVLGQALADAAAEIDGYLVTRLALPLDPVPAVLLRIACDLARYHLYDDGASEAVRARYEDAVAFLKGVAAGRVGLGETGDGTAGDDLPAFSVDRHDFGGSY